MAPTIDDLIGRAEADRAAADQRAADCDRAMTRIVRAAQVADSTHLPADEGARFDELHGQRQTARASAAEAKAKTAALREVAGNDAEITRLQRESHPTGIARPGAGDTDQGVGRAAVAARDESAPRWTRSTDGRGAAVERGQRIADHPVAAEMIARDPGRQITETHSGLGSLVRNLSTTGSSAIVPTLWAASIIDKARNAARVIQAGAETIPMDSKILQIGRLTTDVGTAWLAEGGTRTETDPVFDSITLTAKTLTAFTVTSLEFLQDAIDADAVVEESIAKAVALAIDSAALFGGVTVGADAVAAGSVASPPSPLGILGSLLANAPTSVLGSGANGTAITPATPWNELLTTWFLPMRNNETPGAILMNAAMQQKYAQTYDTLGQPLRLPQALADAPWLITNQIPSFTQGTMTSIATDIFAGDFRQVLIGQRLSFTLQVLTERYAEVGSVGLLAAFRGDIALARPKSMAVYRYIGGS